MRRMDVSHLLDKLNPAQREAVSAPPGHYLVLAGAGSGKTRVLTHRIGWLLEVERVSPWSVLAVTFTNKAAGEMRARLEQLIANDTRGLTVGTFHGIAHRLLRRHWREARLPENVPDSRCGRSAAPGQARDQGSRPRRGALSAAPGDVVHQQREGRGQAAGLRSSSRYNPLTRTLVDIYRAYEEACQRAGLVDFAELLLRAHELWLHNDALLEHYRERYRHLLIDEFQDTNTLQYAWIRVLAGNTGQVFVVGDDDQAIYGWRGARVENVQHFLRDFPGAKTIRLEQNYRSTGTILEGRERGDRAQSGSPRQAAVDRWRRRRAHRAVRGLQRAGRGALRDRAHPRVHRRTTARRAIARSCIARMRSRATSKNS